MRLTAGRSSRANSGHFSLSVISDTPVRLPLGRLRLVTNPAPSGSPDMNTIGLVGAACCTALAGEVPTAKIKLSLRPARSAARSRKRSIAIFAKAVLDYDVFSFD